MKEYKGYLFDADGTLFDTAEMIFQCFNHTCSMFGNIKICRNEVFSNIGIPLRPQLENFLGILNDSRAEEIIGEHMRYQLEIYKDYLCLFPGVADTLRDLKKKGKKLAVVTSRKIYTLTLFLKHTGIFRYFDSLITPESTKKYKPHPEPALEALRQLDCKAHEALFVGDAVFDIECGREAGMDTAFVSWSKLEPDSFSVKPDFIIDRIEELIIE